MIKCDANKLPEEVKEKAHEYVEKRKPRFKTFGITRDDVECAWLNGFAFCLEGTVEVKVKQCATCVYADSPCKPSDYAKDTENVCSHYKDIFDAYTELRKDRDRWLKVDKEDCENWSKDKEQLLKAKELLKQLLTNAPDTYSGTNVELQQKKMFSFQDAVNKAEQFIGE